MIVRMSFQQEQYVMKKFGWDRITKEEFKLGLNDQMSLDNKTHFYLHDFLSPLQTVTKLRSITPGAIFDMFSTNKQHMTL